MVTPLLPIWLGEAGGTKSIHVTTNQIAYDILTQHVYGHPSNGVHGMQIEINRALYMDESSLTLVDGIERLKVDLAGLIPLFSAWISEAVRPDKARPRSC